MLVSMKRNVLEQVAQEPAPATPAKRGRSANRGLIFGIGLTALLGVGAGAAFAFGVVTSNQASEPAPQQLAPIASPSPEPTPTATPSPEPVYEAIPGQPASRFGLDCDTLVDPALVQGMFTTPVESVDPIASASGTSDSIPIRTSIMSIGGTVCEWSNAVPSSDRRPATNYVGVRISVVPRPQAGWSERVVPNELGGLLNTFSYCDDPQAPIPPTAIACYANAEAGDAWVTIEANGTADDPLSTPGLAPLFDAVRARVEAAGPAAPPTILERTWPPTENRCEALLSTDRVRAIPGFGDASAGSGSGGGWSEWGEARFVAGNGPCFWSASGDGEASMWVEIVNGGRWAYERMLTARTTEPVTLTGLGARDAAVIRCGEYGCAVDLAIDLDWVNAYGPDRATAIILAEAVIAQRAELK
jgi:hypothetical protein